MKGILFSGVHGVGKGYFLKKNCENIQNYNVYSASGLIEIYQKSTDEGYKRVQDVSNNQAVLVKAIQEVALKGNKNFIIDGHLCIFNSEGRTERIPEEFFFETKISGIILLQDEAKKIVERLRQRDAEYLAVSDIEEMQQEEKEYAKELKEKHGIKCVIITHKCTEKEFKEIVEEMEGDYIE